VRGDDEQAEKYYRRAQEDKFSKVSSLVPFNSKCIRALTCEHSFPFLFWTQEAEPTHVTTLYNLAGLLKNKKQVCLIIFIMLLKYNSPRRPPPKQITGVCVCLTFF
jgi:hypothetical protein